MRLKTYTFLFCAFFVSTFFHDIHAGRAVKILERKKRSADPPLNCDVVCTDRPPVATSGPALSILGNVNSNLLAVANLTANVGLIFNLNENLVAVVNGGACQTIVINIESSTGFYVSTARWEPETVTFLDFFETREPLWLCTLKDIADYEFKVADATPDVLTAVNEVIRNLVNIGLELDVDPQVGLQVSIAYGAAVIPTLNGVLKGYVELIASTGGITTQIDLFGILNVFKAKAIIFGNIKGGINGALQAGACLNPQAIADSGNGLNFLVTIILQLGNAVDIGTELGPVLNNLDSFLELVALLGGMENTGVSGLFKVLHRVVEYIKGGTSIQIVINTFVEFLAVSGQADCNEKLSSELKASLSALLRAVKQVNATRCLLGLKKIVRALQTGRLQLRGVNLSRILKELIGGVTQGVANLLKVLVTVSLELRPVIDESVGPLACLLVLILDVNSIVGLQLLKGLGIVVDVNLIGASGSMIANILSLVPDLDTLLCTENLYQVLTDLPVFGNIVTQLSDAVSCVTNDTVDLESLLDGSILVQNAIGGIFQLLSSVNLGLKPHTIDRVREMFNTCTSVNFYYSIDYPVAIGVSL